MHGAPTDAMLTGMAGDDEMLTLEHRQTLIRRGLEEGERRAGGARGSKSRHGMAEVRRLLDGGVIALPRCGFEQLEGDEIMVDPRLHVFARDGDGLRMLGVCESVEQAEQLHVENEREQAADTRARVLVADRLAKGGLRGVLAQQG